MRYIRVGSAISSKLNLFAQLLASYVSIKLYAASARKTSEAEGVIVELPCVQEPGPAGSAVAPRQRNGMDTRSDLRDMSGGYLVYNTRKKSRL